MVKNLDYLNQLISYIKKNLRKGYTKESLKWALVGQGHSKIEIDKAFKKMEEELAREAPILKTRPRITYEVIEPQTTTKEPKKKSFLDKWFND